VELRFGRGITLARSRSLASRALSNYEDPDSRPRDCGTIEDSPKGPALMELARLHARKEPVAVGICVVSVILGVLAIRAHYDLPNTIMAMSLTWNITSMWVSRLPRYWNKKFQEVFAIARRGGLMDNRVATFIRTGGFLFLVLWFVAMYRSLKGM